jgi:hypothetical protein
MTTDVPAETSPKPPRLSDTAVAQLLELLKGVDSVELKLTMPMTAHRATIRGLPLDPVEAQPRQVFFFDTPDLDLDRAGIVVRARRIQGGKGDSVVKLRPVTPGELPADLRSSADFNVEVDVLPGGFVCSGTYKRRLTGQEIRDAVGGRLPIRKLFSKEQRAFFADHAPAGVPLDSLAALGPTFVLKATFVPPATRSGPSFERRMVAELWLYPDGSRILELSTKCAPAEAFHVAAEARAYLGSRGIEISGVQQTKTKAALEFFRAELRAAGEGKSVAPAEA